MKMIACKNKSGLGASYVSRFNTGRTNRMSKEKQNILSAPVFSSKAGLSRPDSSVHTGTVADVMFCSAGAVPVPECSASGD